jgi:hypothetical protein
MVDRTEAGRLARDNQGFAGLNTSNGLVFAAVAFRFLSKMYGAARRRDD